MKREFAERVYIEGRNNSLSFDLYSDSEVGKKVSYALRSFRALNALKKAPTLDVGKGIEVYSARIPQFDERSRLYGGFVTPSPHKEGVYWLVMDERLTDDEKLAVAFHEISHFAGGLNSDEKRTQTTAIDGLATLARNYDFLRRSDVKNVLQRDANVRYDISEMDQLQLGRALKWLIDRSSYFGMNQTDLTRIGVASSNRRNLESMLGIVSIFIGIFILLPFPNITGNVIGNQSYFDFFSLKNIFGILLIVLPLGVLSHKKILSRRIK